MVFPAGSGQAPPAARSSRVGYIKKYAFPKGLAIRNIFSPSSNNNTTLSPSHQHQATPAHAPAPRFEVEYRPPAPSQDSRRRRSEWFGSHKPSATPTPAPHPPVPTVAEPPAVAPSHFVASTHKPQRCPLATQHDYPTESKYTYVYQPSVLSHSSDYARSDTESSVDTPVPSHPPALHDVHNPASSAPATTTEHVESSGALMITASRRRSEQEFGGRGRMPGIGSSPPSKTVPAIVRSPQERDQPKKAASSEWEGANWRSSITAAYAPSPKPREEEEDVENFYHEAPLQRSMSRPEGLERRQSERRYSRAVETHHPEVHHRRSMASMPREDSRVRPVSFQRRDRMVEFPALQTPSERPRRPRLTSMSTNSTAKSVRWNTELVCPSPIAPCNRRKGWFNRRGDQLWTNSGAYKPALPAEAYPKDLDGYPEVGTGWMNEEGVEIDAAHHLIPKDIPKRSALKQL